METRRSSNNFARPWPRLDPCTAVHRLRCVPFRFLLHQQMEFDVPDFFGHVGWLSCKLWIALQGPSRLRTSMVRAARWIDFTAICSHGEGIPSAAHRIAQPRKSPKIWVTWLAPDAQPTRSGRKYGPLRRSDDVRQKRQHFAPPTHYGPNRNVTFVDGVFAWAPTRRAPTLQARVVVHNLPLDADSN